jgi:RNA polymerase sigma-70 factor (ECF subfamily)
MPEPVLRFEDAIDRYHAEIHRYVWRLLEATASRDPAQDAADVVQQAFERAYRAFPRLRPHSNVRAWLYKIATNCAYTAMKQRQPATSLEGMEETLLDSSPLPDHAVDHSEARAALYRQIAALPPNQQAALVMRHLHGLDYAEIAEALNCSEDSARANVSHALRRLRHELAETSLREE